MWLRLLSRVDTGSITESGSNRIKFGTGTIFPEGLTCSPHPVLGCSVPLQGVSSGFGLYGRRLA